MKNSIILTLFLLVSSCCVSHVHSSSYQSSDSGAYKYQGTEKKENKTGRLANIKDFFNKKKGLCIGLGIAGAICSLFCFDLANEKAEAKRRAQMAQETKARQAAVWEQLRKQNNEADAKWKREHDKRQAQFQKEDDERQAKWAEANAMFEAERLEREKERIAADPLESNPDAAVEIGHKHFLEALALARTNERDFGNKLACPVCSDLYDKESDSLDQEKQPILGVLLFDCGRIIASEVDRAKALVNEHAICNSCAKTEIQGGRKYCMACRQGDLWKPHA